MKRKLLFTCMLVLGMLSVPVKVIGQNLLPDISIYGAWTVEGTAGSGASPGLKWRVYREDYSNLIMQAGSGSHTTVTKNWVITAKNPTNRSVDMSMLREKVSVAELTCNEIASSYIGAIGEEAFIGFENLQMVYLPQKKTISIGDYAFDGCKNLWSVSGMDYMIDIGERAFAETGISCSEIGTKATASGGNIGFMAFYACKNITDLTIDRVSTIGADAFAFCSGMSSLTLGYGVSTIGARAFNKCDNLREIHIGENVSSITYNAFSSTLNYLDEITVSAQNTSYSGEGNCLIEIDIERGTNTLILGTNSTVIPNTVNYITSNAFNGRTNLSTINIPASVTRIYNYAFDGCTNLREVWCEAETPASLYTNPFANISSNAVLYVPTIDAVTAYKNSDWKDYFSEIKIGKKEENGMSWGLIPYGTEADKYTLWISGIEELGNFSAEGGAPWSKDIDKIVEVDVRYGVKRIGNSAFKGFGVSGTEVTFNLPSSLESIADYAFSGCKRLKSIELPNSLTAIGEGAFQNCSALESVTLGSSVETIGASAFNGTPISSITIPASVKSIGKWAFADCTALESVTFAEGSQLTSIGDNAFNYCNALESIAIPNSVTSIGESAFEMCYGLVSATLSNSMETIPNSMFYECIGLKNVTIPESITTIGNEAFSDCYALESITLPNSVTTVGAKAFQSCTKLESATLSNAMETIPNSMFYECTGLKNITIPESVTSIGEYAFSFCTALPEIIIPNTVTSIEEGAFYKCSGLKAITIGQSVEFIGPTAFSKINSTAVITWLPYEMPELNYQDFPRGIVWRVYYIPNYSSMSDYFTIEAIPVTITDGAVENYEDIYEADILLSRVEYNRTLLADSKWNALYVPFEIPVADIIDKYDVAYINDVRLYDSDNDGEIDENAMEVEVVYVKSGTLHANTPYLIRVKKTLSAEAKEAARAMNLALSTKLCLAEEKNDYDCSSLYKKFTFGGIYKKKTAEELPGAYAISSDGIWQPMIAGSSLKPFRIYMKIENRNGTPFQPDASEAGIRIRVAGEDNATGIAETEGDNGKAEIYDIAGRRVQNPAKGIYVVNGKKTVIK